MHRLACTLVRISTVAVMLVALGAAAALAQEGTEVRQPAAQGSADERTFTGVVSCDWQVAGRYECRRRAREDCIRECVGVGAAYVLVVDDRMYWLSGNASELDHVAGGAAVVTGAVHGQNIRVRTVSGGEKHRSLRFWK